MQQCWASGIWSADIIFQDSILTLNPGQNSRHFADDIFKRIFLNEKFWILIEITLKVVPKVPINNNLALV